MRILLAVACALLLPACAFSESEAEAPGFDHADPLHDRMAAVNALYTEHPVVEIPTAIGNGIGWLAFIQIWGMAAVVEDATRDDDHHPVARGIMAGGGYFGGAVLGSPFLALYWGLYKWWWSLFFEDR